MVACWSDAHQHFGSERVAFQELLEPAANLANEGFPVSPICAHIWQEEEERLRRQSPQTCHELLVDGRAPVAGEIVTLPQLGRYAGGTIQRRERGGVSGLCGGDNLSRPLSTPPPRK